MDKELIALEQRVNELEKEALQVVDFALYEIANPEASHIEKIMHTESGRALIVEAMMACGMKGKRRPAKQSRKDCNLGLTGASPDIPTKFCSTIV
jgi:hypothetical protein